MTYHRGKYPQNWETIAANVKVGAGWKCERCGHPDHKPSGHVLTVHHLDGDKSNCAWWNLAALCQRCHLHVQAKVILERHWMFEHTPWFQPHAAGYYAHVQGLPEDKEYVQFHMSELLEYGRGQYNG